MGTGEPLDNYEEVLKVIRNLNALEGMNIAARRITISTCGIISQIKKLSQEGLQIELSISLHGSNDEVRNQLMPINKKYPLKNLIAACREYVAKTRRQITFEYLMIKDFTITERTAQELKLLLAGLICKINLIKYNPVAEFDYAPLSFAEINSFQKQLSQFGIHSTVRSSRGQDVDAACGQLRHISLQTKNASTSV